MAHWKVSSAEPSGGYRFNGKVYVTKAVTEAVCYEEIVALILAVDLLARADNGLAKQQILESDTGLRLFFIDQLDDIDRIIAPAEQNYATLLFDWEY